jgi:UDP-N-acetylglucosamine--N-acetylmuramyl-(pentapeptide) pyrophosphoryl-undecaprenol N-acetylglucosamine transferase
MATLLVAAIGGHLTELIDIATRLPDDEDHNQRFWVTHDHPQSRSLLADETVTYIPDIGSKDVPGVLRNLPVARRLLQQHRPTRVISTGSAIALSFLPYLAARGVSSHYIESATRLAGPSLSGRPSRAGS